MRVFICLSIFSFMLATCQGDCFFDHLGPPLDDGNVVKPNTCLDRYDGETHPIGSIWSTADCFICECNQDGMRCCQRANGIGIVLRCEKGEHTESYEDRKYWLDDQCNIILNMD